MMRAKIHPSREKEMARIRLKALILHFLPLPFPSCQSVAALPCRTFGSSSLKAQVPSQHPHTDILRRFTELGFNSSAIQILQDMPPTRAIAQWDKIQLLLQEGFTTSEVRLMSKPYVFRLFSRTSYSKLVSLLALLKIFGIREQGACKVLVRQPSLLECKLESLQLKLEFFEKLGLEQQALARLQIACPRILSLSSKTLQQRLAHLQGLGLDTKAICKIISRCPSLICHNFKTNIDAKLRFLQSRGVSSQVVSKMFISNAKIFKLSLENIVSRMGQLQQLGLEKDSPELFNALAALCCCSRESLQSRFGLLVRQGMSVNEAGQLLGRFPGAFRQSDDAFAKKMDYLVNILNRDAKEIVKFPAFLTYSLEKRTIPRFNALAELRKKGSLQGDCSLASVLSCTNEEFVKFQERYVDGKIKKRLRN